MDWYKESKKSKAASKRSQHTYQLVPEWLRLTYGQYVRDCLVAFGTKVDTKEKPFDYALVHGICQTATRTQRNYRQMGQGDKRRKETDGGDESLGEDDAGPGDGRDK